MMLPGATGMGRGRGRGGGGAEGEPVVQPPPLFPPLEFHPAPMPPLPQELANRQQLMLFWQGLKEETEKERCGNRRRQVAPPVLNVKKEPGVAADPVEAEEVRLWARFPRELLAGRRRPRPPAPGPPAQRLSAVPTKTVPTKRPATRDLDEILTRLEQTEQKVIKSEPLEEAEEEKEGEAVEGEEEGEWEEEDEEMDEGTDYNQNYFDNGEGYLDEDDDMDDGPVY